MNSAELVDAIEQAQGSAGKSGAEGTEEAVRYFIFSVGELRFALQPEKVQEIIAGVEVYPMPACPPYVPGLINCHGFPYTAYDLHVLFENERRVYSMFLVLKMEGDNVALGCTEVDELVDIPRGSIVAFSDNDSEGRFSTAVFEYKGQRVLVLSVSQLLKRLELDLG